MGNCGSYQRVLRIAGDGLYIPVALMVQIVGRGRDKRKERAARVVI